jgi:hypothetical protein
MAAEDLEEGKYILKSIKKALGYELDEAFDVEIMMAINTAFATLTDIGVGPPMGFEVSDEAQTWVEFYGSEDLTLNRCKSYVYIQAGLIFDPPETPHLLNAKTVLANELVHRISTRREETEWTPPTALSSSPSLP